MLGALSIQIRELSPDARALALIDALYEAALTPDRWNDALALLKDAVGGTAVTLRVETYGDAGSIRHHWLGFEPAFQRAYAQHYYREDVCSASWPVGRTATAEALVPQEVRRRAPFFNELCVPFQLDDMVGGLVESSARGAVALSIMKPRGAAAFDETHTALLDRVLPHLRRAVRVNTALAVAESERAQHWDALERLSVGVFVLSTNGKVRRANRGGQQLLGHGLHLGREGLTADTAPANRALRRYLAGVRAPGAEGVQASPGVALVRARGAPLYALALPARGAADAAPGDVLLLVTDPEARAKPPPELLTRLFGLTTAEARVALLVGGGRSPKEAAEELGVAWNTVRAQLREIYAKTQTRGQSGLVRCLTRLGLVAAL
jgi:DNA-binding CsgD family transcriptional regulator